MKNRNPIRETQPNYIYSIIGVTLVLVLGGIFGLVLMEGNQVLKTLKERVNVIVELKDTLSTGDAEAFRQYLNNQQFILSGTVEFVDKERGAQMLKEEFGQDFLRLDMPNPLFDIYTFNVVSEQTSIDSLEKIRAELQEQEIVRDVYYQESLAELLADRIRQIGYVALVIAVLFLVIAVFLIHNTIRLALYANRFLIKNMELVGASWNFISRPFLVRSFWQGLFCGVTAILILGILYFLLQQQLPEFDALGAMTRFGILAAALIALGIIINTASTYYVVDKYLKMRVDEMY